MASHVVVIDSTARRAVVKVTPAKHLTDVLAEACSKLGVDARQYGLKHQQKQVDLSLSFRLSGLSSGAKLELVQLSRSPAVVSVALQLPESEAQGIPNGRLVDKFPSSTTLWLILRKFEAGVAGSGVTRNLTARGTPSNTTGAGRLLYETPVVQIMGRELSTFTDLQKTLGQLGFNSGSALLRLSFRATDRPLEQAMLEIETYFKSVDDDIPSPGNVGKAPEETKAPDSFTPSEETPQSTSVSTPSNVQPTPESGAVSEELSTPSTAQEPAPSATISSRPAVVYAPPSSTVPQSARQPFNEIDYVPTVDHAKAHQNLLNRSSRPNRLPTDAELAAQESALQTKLANISEVEVKIRFPEQSQVVSKFGQDDSAQSLYGFVRSCLDHRFANEKFFLSFFTTGASPANQNKTIIPETTEKLLIRDLRMSGRVLVNFSWDQNASLVARGSAGQLLRPELRETASQIKVEDVAAVPVSEKEDKSFLERMRQNTGEGRSGGKKGAGVPKWLKLPGKK